MGTDLNKEDLLELRNSILDAVLENMKTWDNDIETGIGLIESNQVSFDNIKTLNLELNNFDIEPINDEQYNYKLNLIIKELERLTDTLRGKQDALLEGMQQINKKNQVINSYISVKKEAVFIDKDVQ